LTKMTVSVAVFDRRQKLTILVFAIANFCSAICVSLQELIYKTFWGVIIGI